MFCPSDRFWPKGDIHICTPDHRNYQQVCVDDVEGHDGGEIAGRVAQDSLRIWPFGSYFGGMISITQGRHLMIAVTGEYIRYRVFLLRS
jgi:hypothetical protein